MSRIIKALALSPHKIHFDAAEDRTPAACLDKAVRYLDEHLANAFAFRPDLIVLPEVCDRSDCWTIPERLAFYEYRGDKIRDHLQELAVQHHCNIAYSTVAQLDGVYRNCTQFLNRRGTIDGVYCKNHLVPAEHTKNGIAYGTEAPVIETDFGRVGGMICFDIHFDALREQYMKSRPELLVFSSHHHGSFLQQYWAYSCQSYLVAAVHADHGCGQILNPVGKVLARSTYRSPWIACADIDLDYRILHWDHNWPKVLEAQRKYGPDLHVCEPDGLLGLLMLTYSGTDTTVGEIMTEFGLQTWDEYCDFCNAARAAAVGRG